MPSVARYIANDTPNDSGSAESGANAGAAAGADAGGFAGASYMTFSQPNGHEAALNVTLVLAAFGGKRPPCGTFHVIMSDPVDACRDLPKQLVSGSSNEGGGGGGDSTSSSSNDGRGSAAIVVARRGGCDFILKAMHAEAAGAAVGHC